MSPFSDTTCTKNEIVGVLNNSFCFDSFSEAGSYILTLIDNKPGTYCIKIKAREDMSGMSACDILSNALLKIGTLSGIFISLDLYESIIKVGVAAFKDCKALESITLPGGLTVIEDLAFFGCSSLKTVIIPSGVTKIGGGAFADCSSLRAIDIPSSVVSIGANAFGFSKKEEVGSYVIGKGCCSLESVTLHEGLKEIGDLAFRGCLSLKSINMPNSVAVVGKTAFSDCDVNIIY